MPNAIQGRGPDEDVRDGIVSIVTHFYNNSYAVTDHSAIAPEELYRRRSAA